MNFTMMSERKRTKEYICYLSHKFIMDKTKLYYLRMNIGSKTIKKIKKYQDNS